MEKEPILWTGTNKMIPRHASDKSLTIRLPDRNQWKDGLWTDRKGGLIWYTDGSKPNKGTGAVVCAYGTRWAFSNSSQKCMPLRNRDRIYRNRNVHRIWTTLQHLNGSCQETDHGMDRQTPQDTCEFLTGTQTGSFCQKSERGVKPAMMAGSITYRALSPRSKCSQTGINKQFHLRKVPRKRRTNHTHNMWLYLGFCHLHHYVMQPGDYLHFIPSVRLIQR
jgi:hypothetical protein